MSVETTIAISKESAERLRAAVKSANGSIEALNAAIGLMQSNSDKQGPLVDGAEVSGLRKAELASILREIESIASGLEAYTIDIATVQERLVNDGSRLTAGLARGSATIEQIATSVARETYTGGTTIGSSSSVSEAISAAIAATNR